MKEARRWRLVLGILMASALMSVIVAGSSFAQANAGTLKCVGIYSETAAGQISYRVGTGDWVAIKVGDVIPANAEIQVNVAQDWIELTPSNNPNAVYEISGNSEGDIVQKVSDILKSSPRMVSFPQPSGGKPDPNFANKLVVTQYNSRQVYRQPGQPGKDIEYGDVLEANGTVSIIAINTTITLMKADGTTIKVIGPLTFSVQKALAGGQLYKFLNAP
jgi:hypothetical protein